MMKKMLIGLCAIFFAVCLPACAAELEQLPEGKELSEVEVYIKPVERAPGLNPEDSSQWTEASPGYILAEDAMGDFLYLSHFLRVSFPFLDAIYRVYGIDFERLVQQYYEIYLEKEGEISLLHHLETLDHFLDVIRQGERNIGHLYMVNPAYFSYFRLLVGEWRPFNDPASIAAYEAMGIEMEDLEATAQPILDGIGSNIHFQFFPEESAAYVRIHSFMPASLEGDREALDELYQYISGRYDTLIIDISQNMGGGVTWYELFVLPNVYEMPEAELLPGFIKDCLVALDLIRLWDIPYCSINAFDFDTFPDINPEDFYNLSYMINFSIPEREMVERQFHGDLYVIIGPGSSSGADAFARFIRATGFATLVGEPTGGIGGGAEAIGGSVADYVALPNSRLIFRLDLMYSINERGFWNEEVGTMPDIPTMAGRTALQTALYVIGQRR